MIRLLVVAIVVVLFIVVLLAGEDATDPDVAPPRIDSPWVMAVATPPPTTTVVPRARTAPTVRSRSVGRAAIVGDPPDSDFDRLAQCESGARWDLNTGNGYYGGLQFAASTWRAYGGPDLPHQHPREVQIDVARRLWRSSGWAPWPVCSRRVGLR